MRFIPWPGAKSRCALAGLALAAWLPRAGAADVTVVGEPQYTHRHYESEVIGIPEERQKFYQTWCTGEFGLKVSGLAAEPHRVHLAYTEMAMSDPYRRVFDILLNGEVVEREVCIFRRVGNRRPLEFDFAVTPRDGVIEYAQRRSVPDADVPLFCLLEVFDAAGNRVAEQSAWAMRPADWDLRSRLDFTRVHEGQKLVADRKAPPWRGTYKAGRGESAKLTPADVVGPDGIAYPNWKRVGIRGGIPVLPVTLSAADFGTGPDDDQDDSAALQRAIDALEARPGGGVLYIPPGRYYLDRPILIRRDHIVLRGAGARATRLVSRFSKRGEAPEVHGIAADGVVHPQDYFYLWLDPEALTAVRVTVGGKSVADLRRSGRWETKIFYRFASRDLFAAVPAGTTELAVTAGYRDGTQRSVTRRITLDPTPVAAGRGHGSLAVIAFEGEGLFGERIPLAADGRRGDTTLRLAAAHGLAVGDRIQINAPSTPRWDALIETALKGVQNRTNHYEIVSVDGDRVGIGEPLRLDFPVVDGTSVQRLRPLVRCGLEELAFEQAVQAMVHGVMFEYGWECWVRGVEIVQAGDKALYMPHAKRCEVRDLVADRVWYNVGGSGYVGWEHSFDCLMENVTTFGMRHAPVVQWAASGNVIRRSTFHGSDAQWHAGWTNENLFEDVTVEAGQRHGAYGNGMWSSPPEDRGHGPNGPRNVVYNCDISSPKAGLWMGGMNENWLILHNRFIVGRGPGVVAKTASFDHIIAGNVFVLLDPAPAAIYLGSEDCIGVEVRDNRFYGPVERVVGGPGKAAVEEGNRVRASGDISRPEPAVPSIYEWQQANR